MTRLAIIAITGNSQIDQVLAGVIGQLNATGSFEPIKEFQQTPLLSAMTPEVMAEIATASGATPGIVEIEIADDDAAGFKATMAKQLIDRWEIAYAQALERVPAGIARAAVNGELAKVRAGCQAVIDNFGHAPQLIQLSKPFHNVLGQPTYGEEEDDVDDIGEILGYAITPRYVQSATSAPWEMPAEALQPESLTSQMTSPSMDTPAATGTVVKEMEIYGNGHAMASALNQMPANLAQLVLGQGPAMLGQVIWHAQRMDDSHADEEKGGQDTPSAS